MKSQLPSGSDTGGATLTAVLASGEKTRSWSLPTELTINGPFAIQRNRAIKAKIAASVSSKIDIIKN